MDRLTNMEAFVRVVKAGSFTGAARNWNLSKAALSKYVAALEAHLGVELLRRTTRSLSLTAAGETYYERCVQVLGEIDVLEASLHDDHVQARGLLRVTAPPGFMSTYGRLVTVGFREAHPDVEFEIQLTHRMLDLVEEGIDVAIRITSPTDSSLIAKHLAPAPVLAVASPAYLDIHGRPERPKDLLAHSCLVDTNFRDKGRWRFDNEESAEVVEVSGPYRINSPTAVLQLALADQGVALVPQFLAGPALARGELEEVLPKFASFAWAIYAIYPRRKHLAGRVRAFIDYLAQELATGP